MKITAVCCQGCGASLKIEDLTRYITCNYCHARLEVVHDDDDITHTRLHEKPEQDADELLAEVRKLRLQKDLESLDRAWERYRETVLRRDERGKLIEPSGSGAAVMGVVTCFIGGTSLLTALFMKEIRLFMLAVGVMGVGAGVYYFTEGRTLAREYAARRSVYDRERLRLLVDIDQARSRSAASATNTQG